MFQASVIDVRGMNLTSVLETIGEVNTLEGSIVTCFSPGPPVFNMSQIITVAGEQYLSRV